MPKQSETVKISDGCRDAIGKVIYGPVALGIGKREQARRRCEELWGVAWDI